ncbi:MAG: hypothetical protein QOH29_2064, partial [Actinomycetota bacterium]|nr:hypothetical protein [Actinomycetota bacterium]
GPVSAAFNPVVTLTERVMGAVSTSEAVLFIGGQLAGGFVGAVVANLMFDRPAVTISTHVRSTGALWLGEVVATFGLVLVIFGVVRSGRKSTVAFAVGAYITAAYWFTSSTSFANPAAAFARMFSNTFAGIAPAAVPGFVVAQLIGGVVAIGVLRVLYPDITPDDAAEVMLPHEAT